MIQEPFANGQSWIHQLDPQKRILFAVIISCTIAFIQNISVLALAVFFAITLVCMARLPFNNVIKRLAVVLWFLLLVWIVMPLTFEGEILYQIGPFALSHPGIELAAQMTLKSIAILLIFMALVATMTISVLGYSLSRLHVPDKLVYLLLMTYRYVFVIEDEYRRLQTAIKIRGFRSGTNLHSYKTYAYLAGMLFVRASVRAERVHQAMLCRGFNGKFYSLDDSPANNQGRKFSALMIAFIVGLVSMEFLLNGYLL